MDMKKMKIVFILSIVMMFVSSIVSAFAVSAYLYNSNEVSYNNNASGITSTNVQGAIDELYEHATDYTSMNTRVSALEGRFLYDTQSYFSGINGYEWLTIQNTSSASVGKDRGIAIHDSDNKRRGDFYYSPSGSGNITLDSRNSGGTVGSGELNLKGNPVQINGRDVTKIPNWYVDRTSGKTYEIPLSKLKSNHDYGLALVSAWRDLFLLFYISNSNDLLIKNIGGFNNYTATASYDSSTDKITITFNSTIWDGISVLPL